MKIINKLSFSFLTTALVVAPFATTIACGRKQTVVVNEDGKKLEYDKYKNKWQSLNDAEVKSGIDQNLIPQKPSLKAFEWFKDIPSIVNEEKLLEEYERKLKEYNILIQKEELKSPDEHNLVGASPTTQSGDTDTKIANVKNEVTPLEIVPSSIDLEESERKQDGLYLSILESKRDPFNYWNRLKTQSLLVVEVRGISNHPFKCIFEEGTHATLDFAKTLINKFFAETNYGFGMLTLDTIFFSSSDFKLGSGGVADGLASSKSTILVKLYDLNDVNNYQKNVENISEVLKHEYGHHETLSYFDPMGSKQTKSLVENGVIGTDVFSNVNRAGGDSSERRRLIKQLWNEYVSLGGTEEDGISERTISSGYIDKKIYEKFLEPFFGKTNEEEMIPTNTMYDIAYHYNNAEFLNRVINVIEFNPFNNTNNDLGFLYREPMALDFMDYLVGPRKLINPQTLMYTEDSHNLVKAYGKFVYGYASTTHRSFIEDGIFKGYSTHKFDFVKDGEKVSTVRWAKSHFIDKDRFLGNPRIVCDDYAYLAKVSFSTTSVSSLHFYEDTNKDGKFSNGDLEVQL